MNLILSLTILVSRGNPNIFGLNFELFFYLFKELFVSRRYINGQGHQATLIVVNIPTYDLGQGVTIVVDDDRGLLQGFPEIEHRLHGQGGHVRFGPPLSSLLHNLLIFHPPTNSGRWSEYSFRSITIPRAFPVGSDVFFLAYWKGTRSYKSVALRTGRFGLTCRRATVNKYYLQITEGCAQKVALVLDWLTYFSLIIKNRKILIIILSTYDARKVHRIFLFIVN